MRRTHRHRNDEGLVSLAMTAPWQISAILAAAIFVCFFLWLPRTDAFGLAGPALYLGLRPVAAIALLLFASIAIYRFLQSRRIPPRQRSEPGARSHGSETGGDARSAQKSPDSGVRLHPGYVSGEDSSPGYKPAGLSGAEAARPVEWSLTVLRDMEWKRFEDLCLGFYRAKGIRAESTPLGPDGGVDVRLYQDDADPQRCTAVVQCKALNRAIGVALVRELRGVMASEGVDKGFFMASSRYTEEARAFAAANHITLLDGRQLLAMLQRLPAEVSRNLLAAVTAGDWTTPSCPSCGIKMVARESVRGAYWGCAAFPKCRQTLAMRECKAWRQYPG